MISLTSNKGNIIAMVGIRGISMLISFLYVPLLLFAMESNAYAIWLTLTSIISWIVMFDIGIGNGLRNKLSETLAMNKLFEAQSYVSTAYLSICFIGAIIILLFALSFFYINWTHVLNARNFPPLEINLLVLIVGISFILHFILGLINSVLLALRMPAISSLIGCIGQVISYLAVLVMVKVYHITNLITLCSIISIVPIATMAISTWILFSSKYKYLRPTITSFDKSKLKEIFVLGLKFFWLQIITIILFQSNNFIIMHIVGADAVVQYNICYKYLYTLVTVFTLICTPFWSSSTHAYTNKDFTWLKNINLKLTKVSILFALGGVFMVIIANPIYHMWLGPDSPQIAMECNILMLAYCVFMIFYMANGYIINGIGTLRIQTIVTSILAIIYIPTAACGGKYFGLEGVLIALVFNAVVNSIWSKIQLRKILNGSASGIWLK